MFGYSQNMATRKTATPKPVAEREIVRRKSDDERRGKVMKVLATEEERTSWKTAADASGMSLSTWLRHVAIKAAKPE